MFKPDKDASKMKPATKIDFFARASVLAISAIPLGLVQGCGGGGGSSSNPPPATTLSWSVQQTKTFHFTWSDVAGETEYRLMENPDGSSGYNRVATIAADSTSYDLVVSLPKRVSAKYILQSCNSDGCTDSTEVPVSGYLTDGIGYFKASNTSANSQFGYSVALSSNGNTMAIGAPGEGGSGAVYVFKKVSSGWAQDGNPIKASNAGSGDVFGTSVALSSDGTVLAIGAYLEDDVAQGITLGTYTTVDDTAADSGAVYLFSDNGSSWTQTNYIKGSNTVTGDHFGRSVALAKDNTTQTQILAVGADTTAGGGAVYLFSNSGTSWGEDKIVTASNAAVGDSFGFSIALSSDGSTLAVGAFQEDGNASGVSTTVTGTDPSATYDSGAVYLYTSSSSWSQQAYIKASNTSILIWFGYSVALSSDGTTLVVGAPEENSLSKGINGVQNDTSGAGNGAAYIFTNNGSVWSQQTYIKASNTDPLSWEEFFGGYVALSADGSNLVVGAGSEESAAIGINGDETDNSATGSGAVYFFSNSSGSWAQHAYIKAPNTGTYDRFGGSVAISSDASSIAIGAYFEDSGTTGINSTPNDTAISAGAVYLY